MTKSRLSQIGFSTAGLVGALVMLAGNAHAEAPSSITNNQSSSVTIQSESSQSNNLHAQVSVNDNHTPTAPQSGVISDQTTSNGDADGSPAGSLTEDTNNLPAISLGDTGASLSSTDHESTESVSAIATGDDSTLRGVPEESKLTLATPAGTHYSVHKLTKQTEAQVNDSSAPTTVTTNSDPKPLPAMPQGAFILSDTSAVAPLIGRSGLGFLPKLPIGVARVSLFLLLILLSVSLVAVAVTYLRDLSQSGYARAARGSTTNSFNLAFPKIGLSIGIMSVRDPIFVTLKRQVAWR